MNQEEMFKEYRETRDIKLRNEIALNNMGLVHYALKEIYNKYYHDYEELEQEGAYFLLKAIEKYNPNLGYKFSSFAYKYILNASRYRLDYFKNISIDKPLGNLGDLENMTIGESIEDYSQNVEKTAENLSIDNKLRNILSDEEYSIVMLYFRYGYTYKEIAQKKNISTEVVSRIRRQAKRKIMANPYFNSYKEELEKEKEISYLKAYNYFNTRVKSSEIHSPVWDIVLKRDRLENEVIRRTLK